ncbi:MAG TPA: hypothetical protein ENN40_02640 [Candidatus Aminicenantes bacterium]|nr:hypothetical protein [Candidatus Aminicenantes bacterium]
MTPLAALIRAGWKAHSPLSALKSHVKENYRQRWLLPLALVFMLAVFVTLYFFILQLTAQFHAILKSVGLQRVLPTLVILGAQVTALIFSIYSMLANFYFSRDLEWLIPLPLKPRQVVLAKFAHILLNHYALLLPLAGPVLVQYGILEGFGPIYAVRLAALILLVPLIPLAVSALMVILLMRVVNLGRYKEALVVAGALLLMLLALLPQFLIRDHGGGEGSLSDQQVINLFSGPEGITRRITAAFPPARWATSLLDPANRTRAVIHPLLLAGFSLGAFLLLLPAAEKLFYHGLIGLSESSRRKSTAAGSLRFGSGKRPVRALFLRELRIMNRVPMFLLNGMYSTLFIPVLLLVMTSTGQNESARLLGLLTSTNPAIAVLGVAAVCFLSGVMNGTASSAVSREGHSFWISRMIPVPWRLQVAAKFLHAGAIAVLGTAIAAVMMSVALGLPWWTAPAGAFMALTAAVGCICLALLIDLARPLLDWVSPQRAIKQNMNVFFAMLLDIGLAFLLGVFAARLIRAGLSPISLLLAIEGVLLLFGAASALLLFHLAPRLFNRIHA